MQTRPWTMLIMTLLMDRMNKFTLLRAVILAFYYPIKETLSDSGKKVGGFLHYLLTHALKLPPCRNILSREDIDRYVSKMCPLCFTTHYPTSYY